MKKPKAKSQWFPMGLEVEENLEHGYPYIVVHYQKAGTTEIKRGRAMYVCGSGLRETSTNCFLNSSMLGLSSSGCSLQRNSVQSLQP